MLERATACIKAGARDSLRCAQQAPRSKRMLHQTFWNHGAGDIDLPPWAISMPEHEKRTSGEVNNASLPGTDGVFLDFLYPPHALAWLQRVSAIPPSWERWEKRNARRLPEGFVQASRGYSSRTYDQPATKDTASEDNCDVEGNTLSTMETGSPQDGTEDLSKGEKQGIPGTHEAEYDRRTQKETTTAESAQVDGSEDGTFAYSPMEPLQGADGLKDSKLAGCTEGRTEHTTIEGASALGPQEVTDNGAFVHSPGELGEVELGIPPSPVFDGQPLREFRYLLAGGRPARGEEKSKRAWDVYNMLDEDERQDSRLKTEFLIWLATRKDEISDAHCISLYWSLPLDVRALRTYEAALAAFLRRDDLDAAEGLHKEALANIPNGDRITKTLFRYTVENDLWAAALAVKGQYDAAFPVDAQRRQQALFWFHVEDLPNLISVAARFVEQCQRWERATRWRASQSTSELTNSQSRVSETSESGSRDPDDLTEYVALSAAMAMAAFRHFLQPPLPSIEAMRKSTLYSKMQLLAYSILNWAPQEAPGIFENALEIMLLEIQESTSEEYQKRMPHVVHYIYRLYRKSADFRPSPRLLYSLLHSFLTRQALQRRRQHSGRRTLTVSIVLRDWEKVHGKISALASRRLIYYHAQSGDIKKVAETFRYLRQHYPSYEHWKMSLWALIYVHALRADVASAIRVFGAIRRLAISYGDDVHIRWWNILLFAHSRADDVDGALVTFGKMIDSGVKPDAAGTAPFLALLSQRGDVAAVELLLEQYDKLSDQPRNSAMWASHIHVYIRAERYKEAKRVLSQVVAKRRLGEIEGEITDCFNVMLVGHARRNDIDATMRDFKRMKTENVPENLKTYAALMTVLVRQRQTEVAWYLMNKFMPKQGLRPTAYHFALVMKGFTEQGMYEEALRVHRRMENRNVRPSLATQKAYLHAKARYERMSRRKNGQSGPLEGALEELRYLVARDDGANVAQKEATLDYELAAGGVQSAQLINTLVKIHGHDGDFGTVQELLALYQESTQKQQNAANFFPMQLLAAYMEALFYAEKYDEVEKCWKIAKRQADGLSTPTLLPDFTSGRNGVNGNLESQRAPAEPDTATGLPVSAAATMVEDGPAEVGFTASQAAPEDSQTMLQAPADLLEHKPVAGRKRILARHLHYYLRSLSKQNRIDDMLNVFTRLMNQGYAFDSIVWNRMVEFLCKATPPLVLLAFVLTERFLIRQFPGWTRRRRPIPPNRGSRREGLHYIRGLRYNHVYDLVPQYRTMLSLASGLVKLRRMEALGQDPLGSNSQGLRRLVGTTDEIAQRAPKTLSQVERIPRVDEKWQNVYLRSDDD